jgi:hypothetical protein
MLMEGERKTRKTNLGLGKGLVCEREEVDLVGLVAHNDLGRVGLDADALHKRQRASNGQISSPWLQIQSPRPQPWRQHGREQAYGRECSYENGWG